MRIVFDTNVMVAALRSQNGASRGWLEAALTGKINLILSVPLMLEYEAVLKRPEILTAANTDEAFIDQLLDALAASGTAAPQHYLWRPVLRDPEDEMVLEAAMNGNADILLTFNVKDFKGAQSFNIEIMTPGKAWKNWKGGS